MTATERVHAVVDYGFTEREARFLVLVMRHSGLCIKRQYAAYAGIANGGDRCNALFAKLVRRGFATVADCIHHRARLYHVHHKPLYHAIGEPDNRYRRTVPARAAAERLVRLDAALMDPDLDWLTMPSEKVDRLPASPPGSFPIGIDASGRPVFVYVAMKPWTDDFRAFLSAHVPLLSVTPAWTLRIAFPQALHRVVPQYQRAVYDELESRLDEHTLNELSWYFVHCRRTDWREYKGVGSEAVAKRFGACTKTFKGLRFTRLYRLWLTDEKAALTPVPLAVSEAFSTGRARLHCVVLPHDYEPFSPLVNRRDSGRSAIRLMPRRGMRPRAASTGSLTGSSTGSHAVGERRSAPAIGATCR